MELEEAVEVLRAAGGRVTVARRAVLEVMAGTEEHLTAEQLAQRVGERLPEVHRSTIYRSLEDLEGFGLVSHSHLGHGALTYQLAAVSHAHFVCGNCGRSFHAPDGLFRSLVARAERDHGFKVDVHHVTLPGRCGHCAG